jgi:DNA-binding PadR family transcriptional regulator
MTTNGITNDTQAVILGLLHDVNMTGHDIVRESGKWMSGYWNMTRSQVYRELITLADNGLIKEGEKGARGSTPYKITPAGKRAFKVWSLQRPEDDGVRSQMAMRLAFGLLQEDDMLQGAIETMMDRHEAKITEAKALIEEAQRDGMLYDAIALDFTLRYHKMAINWLKSIELPEL